MNVYTYNQGLDDLKYSFLYRVFLFALKLAQEI